MGDRSKAQEDRLIAAAIAGIPGALDTLLEPHLSELLGFCRQLVADDAEDICQDALVAAIKGLSTFEGRSRFSTWLCEIAKNVAKTEYRKRELRPRPSGAGEDLPQRATREDVLSLPGRLREALAKLRPDYRDVWLLREVRGLSYIDIAHDLGIAVSHVRKRLYNARVDLRLLLGEL